MKKQLCLLLLVAVLVFDLCVASNDTHTLTQFRLQTDVHGALVPNWSGGDACVGNWHGVNCSDDGRVTSLTLPSLFLRGPVDALSSLDHLRLLDLHDNRLNGTVLPLSNCTKLTLLYLAGNDFSGEIPPEIGSLDRLVRLDISDNNVRGAVPEEISKLTRLLTLRLQNNLLSGEIPDLSSSLIHLEQLNFTNNQLYGRVPEGLLRKFGEGSFSGNEGLCGSIPLPPCSSDQTVPSNPTSFPQNPAVSAQDKKPSRKGLSRGAVVAIVVANCVAFVAIVSFIVAHYYARDRRSSDSDRGSEYSRNRRSEKAIANCGGDSDGTNGTDRSKLVFFDRKKQFELEDLLRASAEMLGKGSLGTVYRAVLDDGSTVAVKRLKDANPCARKEFEQYMGLIGKLNHPNIVTFRGYYYAKEEKLLVYDYLPNRTLHSLLHGNRGPGRIPLDWTTRIGLVLGAARGLAWVHHQYSAPKVPHGNVKSSNVLLDKNGVACLSDFGLSLLLNPVHAIARMGGYKAPEQDETKRLSQNADVYSFGVLLLEVLTGRAPSQHGSGVSEDDDLPRWVRSVVMEEWTAEVFDQELMRYKGIEEELVSMLHVALACVAPQPEKRPTMSRVVKMIEDIRVEQSPLVEDSGQSRNSLSPSLPTTDDGLT